mmetsp:Transcript_16254/g.52956  ORF Transcript_16254/g.52956 Transcript_16254/m.52956 type:complete len:200 (+) Transcript_16254:157-756(+)
MAYCSACSRCLARSRLASRPQTGVNASSLPSTPSFSSSVAAYASPSGPCTRALRGGSRVASPSGRSSSPPSSSATSSGTCCGCCGIRTGQSTSSHTTSSSSQSRTTSCGGGTLRARLRGWRSQSSRRPFLTNAGSSSRPASVRARPTTPTRCFSRSPSSLPALGVMAWAWSTCGCRASCGGLPTGGCTWSSGSSTSGTA